MKATLTAYKRKENNEGKTDIIWHLLTFFHISLRSMKLVSFILEFNIKAYNPDKEEKESHPHQLIHIEYMPVINRKYMKEVDQVYSQYLSLFK